MSIESTSKMNFVNCLSPAGLHRMAYKEWGDPHNPRVLLCVHGLTRRSDDFDVLAKVMATDFRVICPDVVGRGQSDWLAVPAYYQVPQYMADMVTLLARINAPEINWFGTSMGGLIGMGLAALKNNPVKRLLLNDVGPSLAIEALTRIGRYVGNAPEFDSIEAGISYLKAIAGSFGQHTEQEWEALMRPCIVKNPANNRFRVHYDPAIAAPFKLTTPEALSQGEVLLWRSYDAIQCPTLVVRGANSDLLTEITAEAMRHRGPMAKLAVIADTGHAPTFVHEAQIALAQNFFNGK